MAEVQHRRSWESKRADTSINADPSCELLAAKRFSRCLSDVFLKLTAKWVAHPGGCSVGFLARTFVHGLLSRCVFRIAPLSARWLRADGFVLQRARGKGLLWYVDLLRAARQRGCCGD